EGPVGQLVAYSLSLLDPPRSAACRSWTPPGPGDRRGSYIARLHFRSPMLAQFAIDLVVLVDPGLEPLEKPGKRSAERQQERDLDHSIFLPMGLFTFVRH